MQRDKRARGGVSTALDLAAGLIFWIILIFLLVDLVQIGRGWQVAQNAAADAAQGTAIYGCWTQNVTTVVQTDLSHITLAPGKAPTVQFTNSLGTTSQVLYVSTHADPTLHVTIGVPIAVGSWLGLPTIPVTMVGRASVTSAAYENEGAIGGIQCAAPQV